ncbi:MAG TPA: SRPBCC family protein [Candidatus Limnocylindrales bacterium]|nr:SRPBCC family protein [Candidatus Limnocylindrales bacterium]
MGVEQVGSEIDFEELLAFAALHANRNNHHQHESSVFSGSVAVGVAVPAQPDANDSIAAVHPLYRLEFERTYALPVERVWSAVSDATELAEWMKYPVSLDPRLAGIVRVDFAPDEPLEGIISVFDPLRSLAFTWGDSIVRWDLKPSGSSTVLRLSHVGVSPELVVALGAGWHAFLDQLEDHLSSSSHPDRYVDLTERYHAALRPLLVHP